MARRVDDMDIGRSPEMPPLEDGGMNTMVGDAQVIRRGNRAVVDFAPGMDRFSQDDSDEHGGNIIDFLEEGQQADLANKVIEWVDVDLQSRKDWQRRMDQAMELMGITNVPLDELPFDGASAVTYPLIGEAVVQFQARAIEEIFPSEGPVKTKIVGEMTREKEEQGDRVKNHMNYQILDQDRSYFWHTDQMLFYLPLVGSAFKKTYWCSINEMVVSRFVNPGDFIVPYIATDLASSPRYTHRMYKSESEMRKLFESGFYREIDLPDVSPNTHEENREMQDQADDRSPEMDADDNVYTLYECHVDLDILDEDHTAYGKDAPLPYIVTVEKETRKVLSIRRNWKEDDPRCNKRIWFTHYKYLPGLGFYGFGLLHIIGSVAEATSGSIRALLDSAAFANMQGGFASNDAKMGENNYIEPGVYKEVNMSAEELSRAFYTPPFKDPSPALARLFEVLVDAGKSFSNSTEVLTGEASNTGPVGTTIALIEQGSKPFSAIHRRLHMAAAEEFKLRAELNYEFLPDNYPYKVEDEESVVLREDYDGRVDIIPISDPNIFSSTQRIAQAQALVELADTHPQLYNQMEVHERFLKAIRIPDWEAVLQKQEKVRLDPITENMQMMQGQGANAFIDQDHDAHIKAHINFANGLQPEALELMGPIMQAHLAEHYAFKYWVEMNRQMGGQLPQPGQFNAQNPLPPEIDQQIAQMAAQVPVIQIMEESMDETEEAYEREEARKDDAHEREQARKDEATLAEIERQEMLAMNKEQREDFMARRKEQREARANEAKIERENKLAAAKAAQQKKAQKSGNGKA